MKKKKNLVIFLGKVVSSRTSTVDTVASFHIKLPAEDEVEGAEKASVRLQDWFIATK